MLLTMFRIPNFARTTVEAKLFDIATVYRSLLPNERNKKLPTWIRAVSAALMTYAIYLFITYLFYGPSSTVFSFWTDTSLMTRRPLSWL